jgi:hypothetical protein
MAVDGCSVLGTLERTFEAADAELSAPFNASLDNPVREQDEPLTRVELTLRGFEARLFLAVPAPRTSSPSAHTRRFNP